MPPLGLDPGLPDVIACQIARVASEKDLAPMELAAVLLAHGSRRNPTSREATDWIASEVAKREVCRDIAVAFLEEQPRLEDAFRSIRGPAVVVGMFSGEGLHGARDAPRLIAQLGRPDVHYAGVIGSAPEIAKIVGCSVLKFLIV